MTGEPDDPPQVATVCSTPCSPSVVFHCRQSPSGSVISPPNAMCLCAPCGCPIMHKRLRIFRMVCTLDVSSRESGCNVSKFFLFASFFGHLIVNCQNYKVQTFGTCLTIICIHGTKRGYFSHSARYSTLSEIFLGVIEKLDFNVLSFHGIILSRLQINKDFLDISGNKNKNVLDKICIGF